MEYELRTPSGNLSTRNQNFWRLGKKKYFFPTRVPAGRGTFKVDTFAGLYSEVQVVYTSEWLGSGYYGTSNPDISATTRSIWLKLKTQVNTIKNTNKHK